MVSLTRLVTGMTQQYIAGEFSALLADLYAVARDELAADVRALRHQVESAPVAELAPLAVQAEAIADAACWSSLEDGDTGAFTRQATAAALLHEFAVNANLLS
jgi:hypothetical protein